MSYTTSAVVDVWQVLTARMDALTFPTVPEAGGTRGPRVWFGDPAQPLPADGGPAAPLESVVVLSEIESPDINWSTIGQYAREEVWRTGIRCRTAIPGRTALQAVARLKEITATIEADVRAGFQAPRKTLNVTYSTNGLTAGSLPTEFKQFDLWEIAVDRVQPVAGIAEGYIAEADVLLGCKFRINKTAIT